MSSKPSPAKSGASPPKAHPIEEKSKKEGGGGGGSKGATPTKPAAAAAAAAVASPKREAEKQTEQPGMEFKMETKPIFIRDSYKGSEKLKGKVALITGGDSGIGRAIAVHFAREGADVAILHHPSEERDAKETSAMVCKEGEGRRCVLIPGDLATGGHELCHQAVDKVVQELGRIDILVNNASEQHYHEDISEVTAEEIQSVFAVNVLSYFFLAQAALRRMPAGSSIINTTSVVAYKGSPTLLTYSASKGAETAMTRALANLAVDKGVRVNAVAPGRVWTPLVASTFGPDKLKGWVEGGGSQMGRPAHPCEVAPAYVFLASEDASFYVGQTLHPDGGVPLGV